MAEKNYKTVAVVPEMPRTIDAQQFHIYTPVGSTDNFGVFKPDGEQFVIVDGVLRADASKLIQLASPPAIVTENGVVVQDSDVGVDIAFTEPDNKLNRKFQFTFKNIKGKTGATGATGLSALQTTYTWTSVSKPVIDTTSSSQFFNFNRTPVVGDTFIAIYRRLATDLKTILGVYLVYCEITSVDESSTSCNFKLVRFQEIPIKYITQITGPVTEGLNDTYTIVFSDGTTHEFVVTNGAQGPQGETGPTGEQGPKGDDGVSITSVTQTGVQGGTQVTITLSNGQSTSFVVYNGINTNFQVVNSLPTENISTSTIYLVPATTPSAENVYDEYIYVNGDWEHIGSTSIDLSGKLDKVTEVTDNTQFYAKAPDGSQVMTEIKGGNGITVGAASDNKFLEVKVGDTIKLENNQTLKIVNPFNTKYVSIGNNKMDFSPVATRFSVDSLDYDAYANKTYGPDIKTKGGVITNRELSLHWFGLNMCYEITGVTTSSTSGTLPDNVSWQWLKQNPDIVSILFNNEFYQLADNQHTTGTLVYSHVTYEGGQLIVKAITITIATRGWVLTTVSIDSSAPTANFITLRTTSGTLSDADFTKLDGDDNSYILLIYSGQKYKLHRTATSTTDLIYSVVDNEQEYKITILLSDHTWGLQVITLENTANRVTEIKASSADEEYPSAAATYTYGQTVLNDAKSYANTAIANAITTALNTPV